MNALYLAPTCLPDAAPLTLIDAAARTGYQGVGLRLHPSPNLPYHPVVGQAGLIRDIEHALRDSGLVVLDILAFYLQADFNRAAVLPALDLAARFGARHTLVQGDDTHWARLCDHFGEFCEAAAEFGLCAALEFVPSRPLATLTMAQQLLKDTQQANAAILVDALHLIRSGGSAKDLAGIAPNLLPYAQISDGLFAPGEPDLSLLGRMPLGKRALPGDGCLPLREILAALPPDIPLSLEVTQPAVGNDAALTPPAWARRVLESTQALLQ